jgi:hypothetical protein
MPYCQTLVDSRQPTNHQTFTTMLLRNAVLLLILISTASAIRPRASTKVLKTKKSFLERRQNAALSIRGGGGEDLGMAGTAFDWCANLGAPAALVGGAVLATLAETREDMAPKRRDSRRTRLVKQVQRFLLVSAFGLEIISIFATTVTGTMLLSQGDRPTGSKGGDAYHSPMVRQQLVFGSYFSEGVMWPCRSITLTLILSLRYRAFFITIMNSNT